jgi:MFS family permease
MGLLFIAPLSLIAHYFQRRRSLAMGIAISGSSFAGVIVPIMLNKLFEHPGVGFAWGVRAFAFMELGMLLIANFLLHPRLPNRREREAAGIKTPKPDVKGISRDYVWLTVGAS